MHRVRRGYYIFVRPLRIASWTVHLEIDQIRAPNSNTRTLGVRCYSYLRVVGRPENRLHYCPSRSCLSVTRKSSRESAASRVSSGLCCLHVMGYCPLAWSSPFRMCCTALFGLGSAFLWCPESCPRDFSLPIGIQGR